jgi:hypothetical protein
MASGIPSVFPTQLVELLVKRLPAFAELSTRHRYNIARMLWDYANNRYQHSRYAGAAFSVGYMEDLWGNRRTRNQVVPNFFSCNQGDNHSHLMSNYSPYKFLGEVLLEYLEDVTPIDFMDGDKLMRMPPNPVLSRAATKDPNKLAKHSQWRGVRPSPYLPINQEALLEFYRASTDMREKMSALRLLRLSRNKRWPGQIPLLYEQKSSGRLTEVLFSIQSTQREVLSAALDGHWDYDLSNAHFSILSAWAKRLGKTAPVVDNYLRNKKAIRAEVAAHCDSPIDLIKECLIALLYGAPLSSNPDYAQIPKKLGVEKARLFVNHPFVKSLKKEISELGGEVVADTHSTRGCYVNAMGIEAPQFEKKNATFNLLCHALQGVEALSLKAVVTEHGEDILLCMHDGWVSSRRLNSSKLQDLIYAATGFELEIEEQILPKYAPTLDGSGDWGFSDSTPVGKGGLVVSNAPAWNTRGYFRGRVTRTDLPRKFN